MSIFELLGELSDQLVIIIPVCFRQSRNNLRSCESIFLIPVSNLFFLPWTLMCLQWKVLSWLILLCLLLGYLCLLRSGRLVLSRYLQLQSDLCFYHLSWLMHSQAAFLGLPFVIARQYHRSTKGSPPDVWWLNRESMSQLRWECPTVRLSMHGKSQTNSFYLVSWCTTTSLQLIMWPSFSSHKLNNRNQWLNQAPVNQTTIVTRWKHPRESW